MSETTYTLHLNATQAAAISHACEVLARLGMGQYKDAMECLPLREFCPEGWHEDMDGIGHIIKKHTTMLHGVGSCHPIGSDKTSAESKTAWDVYQVLRHRLAWDAAQAEGHPGEGNASPPRWSVQYDKPMRTSAEPLAWIESAGK
jgi:hypothetical protein